MPKEASKTCRTCLGKHAELLPMYNGDDNRIVEMLEYILDSQVEFTDGLPHKVCHKCFEDISLCYSFKTKCNNSFKTLRILLDKRKNTQEMNIQIKLEPELNISEQFLGLGETQTTLDESYHELLTTQPAVDIGEISIKIEPNEIVPASCNDFDSNNLARQLRQNEMLTSPSTTATDSNNQFYSERHEQNTPDIHTVQYLIKELKEEPNSTDPVVEVEVNIRHCASCKAGFASKRDFNSHLKKCGQSQQIHNARNKHLCPYCDKAFPRPCRLKNHVRKHLDFYEADKRSPPKKQHICPHCDSSFTLEASLILHLSFHTGKNHLNNSSNQTKFNNTINLETNQKKHKCEECGQRFEWASQLKNHMLDHKGDYAFICKLCPKKFIHPDQFKAHSIQVHNDERPFKCKFCGVGFTNKYNVVYHQRKHISKLEQSAYKHKSV